MGGGGYERKKGGVLSPLEVLNWEKGKIIKFTKEEREKDQVQFITLKKGNKTPFEKKLKTSSSRSGEKRRGEYCSRGGGRKKGLGEKETHKTTKRK